MKLEIGQDKNLQSVKDSFNRAFPYLKLEFFRKPHHETEGSPRSQLIEGNIRMGDINPTIREGNIIINETDTVNRLEQAFRESYGLSIQVFRKQDNIWIETTRTDSMTLAEQNEKGKEASLPKIEDKPGDRYLEDGQF